MGDKPWIVYFGSSPRFGDTIYMATDNAFRNLACFAKLYGDQFNVGFVDYSESEFIYESYDFLPEMSKRTPVMAIFANGKAYQPTWACFSNWCITDFIADYANKVGKIGPQSIVKARGDFTIFLEYAKRFITETDGYRMKYYEVVAMEGVKDTWIDTDILKAYFDPELGIKVVGRRILKIIVITSFLVLYMLYELICCLCCKKKTVAKAKSNKTSGAEKETTPASKSQRQKIE